ncbi:MAG TPA: hypothetical protein VNJ51_11260 [Candidatus Dormibacteraeota bacterium]|nr:hypothetical protein [Candidatus Dormibacteraeota bacterium]
MTYILVEDEVACPPESVPVRLAAHLGGDGEIPAHSTYHLEVPFEDVGLPKIGEFTAEVQLDVGEPERHRAFATLSVTRIPIRWSVPSNSALPTFEGYIEVTPLSRAAAQLAVIGHYRPPGSLLGAAFDAAAGRRMAEATARHFLRNVKRAVERTPASAG